MESYNLLDFLGQVPDVRRGQGKRHRLSDFLAMLILAIISGQNSIRGFTRFMRVHEQAFCAYFSLKHGVPSFGTTRTLLEQLDHNKLAELFTSWMSRYFPDDHELWLSLDGKALSSTVKHAFGANQNFVYLVSAFAQHSGIVYTQLSFNSGKAYEAEQVRQLIEQLQLSDVNYCLDALHCQKKHCEPS